MYRKTIQEILFKTRSIFLMLTHTLMYIPNTFSVTLNLTQNAIETFSTKISFETHIAVNSMLASQAYLQARTIEKKSNMKWYFCSYVVAMLVNVTKNVLLCYFNSNFLIIFIFSILCLPKLNGWYSISWSNNLHFLCSNF